MIASSFSNEDTTYVNHRGVKRKTDLAVQFMTDTGDIWIPKRFIQTQDNEIFAIPTWFAKQKGIKAPRNGEF